MRPRVSNYEADDRADGRVTTEDTDEAPEDDFEQRKSYDEYRIHVREVEMQLTDLVKLSKEFEVTILNGEACVKQQWY